MPAKNIYHDTVSHGLQADGWTITHDPLWLSFGGRDLFVDLGAEQVTIGAERGNHKTWTEGDRLRSFESGDCAMDKIERYRDIVERVVEDYAKCKPSHGQIETEAIRDREHDHYELMHVGWDGERRVHGSVIHVDIHDGKIWIQYDGTNRPVADELLAAGIPKEDIVLAFHPPDLRRYTGFAVE